MSGLVMSGHAVRGECVESAWTARCAVEMRRRAVCVLREGASRSRLFPYPIAAGRRAADGIAL